MKQEDKKGPDIKFFEIFHSEQVTRNEDHNKIFLYNIYFLLSKLLSLNMKNYKYDIRSGNDI
jgi:hypothetical protein